MSTRELIDELDRCKTALQVVAEMQPDGLATLLDLLLDCLDDAIGQVQAHPAVHLPRPAPRPGYPGPPAPRCPHHVQTAKARCLRGLTPRPLSCVSVLEACLTGERHSWSSTPCSHSSASSPGALDAPPSVLRPPMHSDDRYPARPRLQDGPLLAA